MAHATVPPSSRLLLLLRLLQINQQGEREEGKCMFSDFTCSGAFFFFLHGGSKSMRSENWLLKSAVVLA
ncbi:hypothetical protein XELAEV_18032302mg [Xenopus laevis]|uniref:Secreted protein n=1 Tax=Xenopus laevis TaxID=8355 RepID=A0A974HGI0_XENLA|nr:hypothetical protein XELAEV_18032302mg [Xenopus laevis]